MKCNESNVQTRTSSREASKISEGVFSKLEQKHALIIFVGDSKKRTTAGDEVTLYLHLN